MQKAIYGLLRSALLIYMKFVADLESIGFVLNPYDPWIANKVSTKWLDAGMLMTWKYNT